MAEAKIGMFVYATRTPVNYVMDIPANTEHKEDPDKDLETLWRDAVNYGNNGKRASKPGEKGTPGQKVKTTEATQRFSITGRTLIGFKSKVDSLPFFYEKAAAQADSKFTNDVVNAEHRISTFKKTAARLLKEAVAKGVTGYDKCVEVIKQINEQSVTGITKIEFFLKRVDVKPFEGSSPGKDGLHYLTVKLRKFYTTAVPTVSLLESVIQNGLIPEDVVAYNADWKFAESAPADRRGKPAISMQRVGYQAVSDVDKAILETLRDMRRPKA